MMEFEDLDRSVEVEDSSRTKMEMTKQEKETPKEANFEKATILKEKVPIARAGSSSTTEGSKERSCEPNTEEEKRVLQDLVRNLERILNEQNEYITTLRREHNGQSLKRRWTPGNGDAWVAKQQIWKMEVPTPISVKMTCRLSFWIRLGIICPSHMFIQRMGLRNLFWN